MPSGVILAGGRSTRFGEDDKAVAPLAGTPMIRWVVDRLAAVLDEVVVNCREAQRAAIEDAVRGVDPEIVFAPDPEPDQGPLAGIRTGLDAASSTYAVVVACDMPFVDPALVRHLFSAADGHDAAVPRLEDGWFQTTQAVYRTDTVPAACERALDRGDGRIVAAFDDLDIRVVEANELAAFDHQESFRNVNTREEFEAAAEELAAESQSPD